MPQQAVYSASQLDGLEAEKAQPFRAVAPWKVVLMSLGTFSFYQIVWCYRNWVARKQAGEDVSPVPRAIFGVFFFPALVSRVRGKRLLHDLPEGLNPGVLGAAYFALNFAFRLPDPYWIVGFLSFIPVVVAQQNINSLHRHLGYASVDSRLGVGSLLALTTGGAIWLLVVIGLLLPEP
jgi:hypothetical protein